MVSLRIFFTAITSVNYRRFLGILLLAGVFAGQVNAQQSIIPRAPQIAATSYILMDAKPVKSWLRKMLTFHYHRQASLKL